MSLADIIFREAPWIEEESQGRALVVVGGIS